MLVERQKCCGCGVCALVCQDKAITMEFDREGFLYPIKNKEKCSKCGLCIKHCPAINSEQMNEKESNLETYAGYYEDNCKLKKSSSGGAASALAESIINLGGTVFGVVYGESYKYAQYVECHTEEQVDLLRGSKYFQSRKNDIYIAVKKELEKGKVVLYIGLPCEIAAIRNYLKYEYEKFYTCELICHGPTSELVQRQFVEYLEKKFKSKITNYSVRFKKDAWVPLYVRAEFESGKVYEVPLNKTKFGYAFSVFIRQSCYNCLYRGSNSRADLTVGDFWGNIQNTVYWNKYGVSVLISRTKKGKKLIKSLSKFKIFDVEYEAALSGNPRLEESETISPQRAKFSKKIVQKGLTNACFYTRTFKKNMADIYYNFKNK